MTLREVHVLSSIPVQITLSIDLNFTPNHVAIVNAHLKRQSDESTMSSKVLVQHNYAIFLTVISSYVSGPTFSQNKHFLKNVVIIHISVGCKCLQGQSVQYVHITNDIQGF